MPNGRTPADHRCASRPVRASVRARAFLRGSQLGPGPSCGGDELGPRTGREPVGCRLGKETSAHGTRSPPRTEARGRSPRQVRRFVRGARATSGSRTSAARPATTARVRGASSFARCLVADVAARTAGRRTRCSPGETGGHRSATAGALALLGDPRSALKLHVGPRQTQGGVTPPPEHARFVCGLAHRQRAGSC